MGILKPARFEIALLGCLLACSMLRAQDANLEDRVKAIFIFNFAQYTEWPQSVLAAPSFTICIVGASSFQPIIAEAVRGETLNGKSITVKSLSAADNVAACHIIYFRASTDRNMRASILAAAKNSPILTVGELPDFIRSGGIICFTKAENRIRFEINPAAADQRSISLSSRLLRLAEIVGAQ